MVVSKTVCRTRFGVRALIVIVAVCAVVSWALRLSRDSRPAHLYSAWLGAAAESIRIQAAQELGGVDEDRSLVVTNLTRALLSDRNVDVRKQAARSLARVVVAAHDGAMTSEAARGLVQALGDNDASVRAAVADALGQIAPAPEVVVPELLRAAKDDDQWARGAVIAALGLIQKKANVDREDVRVAMAAAMIDPSPHVREMGIYAFWATAEVSPALSRALLSDGDVRVRRAAALALARSAPLAEKVAYELTAARLADPDTAVSDGAERALENLGER
jgi:HEAT repeat protein